MGEFFVLGALESLQLRHKAPHEQRQTTYWLNPGSWLCAAKHILISLTTLESSYFSAGARQARYCQATRALWGLNAPSEVGGMRRKSPLYTCGLRPAPTKDGKLM